jgi:hypothetical protein
MFITIISMGTETYAQNWIPYQGYQQEIIQQTTVNHHQNYVYQPQPTIVYQYIPYVVNQPIVVEQRCLLYKTQRVVYTPQVQYFYQPILVYR